jgi:PQQ-like domain
VPRLVFAAAIVAAVATGASRAAAPNEWLSFGNGASRQGAGNAALPVAALKPTFYLPLDGRVTSQILAADGRLYAATSSGRVYAFTPDGYVLWSRNLGQLAHACPQLDGYGVTGTGAIDAATHTLYVADAFGRLHALDLGSGAERTGWPVRVIDAPQRELAWGALLFSDGKVFVPTGSYCDAGPMQGHVYAVDVATHEIRSWASVPEDAGGGGGIWGWGGIAYSAERGSLFVAVGNAFADGNETAGYGEHLVELSPQLDVRAASTTPEPARGADADLVGSPVLFTRAGCGELAVVARKDGSLFAWRTASVDAGPIWNVEIEPYDDTNPVLAQPVYDARRNAVFVVTGARVARVDVGADCSASVAWSRKLGTTTENGIPTVAGDTLWVPLSGRWSLAAIDTSSGTVQRRLRLSEATLTPPTIVDGRLFVGSFTGGVHAFATAATPAARSFSATREHASWPTARLGWESRADGVYATDDRGAHWQRIYGRSALSVVRLSRRTGVIVTDSPVPACGCHPRIFSTTNGGRTWQETRMLSPQLVGSGGRLYWINTTGTAILRVDSWRRSHVVLRASSGRFDDAVAIRGGIAALVTSRVNGRGWDVEPTVMVLRNGHVTTRSLPSTQGQVLVDTVAASWPTLVVRGTDYDTGEALTWRSRDGGATWTLRRL